MKKWIYRDFELKDYDEVEKLLDEMEHFKRITPNHQVRKRIIAVYLRSCLEDSTFTKIVTDQGKVIGIICGRCNKQLKKAAFTPYTYGLLRRLIGLHLLKEGRKAIKVYREYAHEYENLMGNEVKSFEGELTLLLVHPTYRKLGIGKELFDEFINYMDQMKAKNFYLITDSACEYTFYERRGCRKIAQQKAFLGKDMEIYLYEKKV